MLDDLSSAFRDGHPALPWAAGSDGNAHSQHEEEHGSPPAGADEQSPRPQLPQTTVKLLRERRLQGEGVHSHVDLEFPDSASCPPRAAARYFPERERSKEREKRRGGIRREIKKDRSRDRER